jgi:hypothetical protein
MEDKARVVWVGDLIINVMNPTLLQATMISQRSDDQQYLRPPGLAKPESLDHESISLKLGGSFHE